MSRKEWKAGINDGHAAQALRHVVAASEKSSVLLAACLNWRIPCYSRKQSADIGTEDSVIHLHHSIIFHASSSPIFS
jgi:hypothetical protein